MEPFLGNTENASKFDKRVHETGTDSSVGETVTRDGFHLAGLSDGHRLAEGSVSTHAQGWCCRCGPSDRGRVRAGLGGQPPEPARPREVRHLQSSACAASAHSKRGSTTETRPLGIPTLEDKLLQRAGVMLQEPIYEQDFLDCSYCFRPGRSGHFGEELNPLYGLRVACRSSSGSRGLPAWQSKQYVFSSFATSARGFAFRHVDCEESAAVSTSFRPSAIKRPAAITANALIQAANRFQSIGSEGGLKSGFGERGVSQSENGCGRCDILPPPEDRIRRNNVPERKHSIEARGRR